MNAFLQLIIQTFLHPREIAAGLTAERYDRGTLWTGAFVVIIVSGIVQYLLMSVMPALPDGPGADLFGDIFATPMISTLVIGCLLIATVFAVYFAGRMMGGTGHFPETLVVVTWIQMLKALAGGISVILLSTSPALVGVASLVSFATTAAIFYVTLHFIDVLHGYDSLWAAFGTVVISSLGFAIGLALIIAVIGGAAIQTGAI